MNATESPTLAVMFAGSKVLPFAPTVTVCVAAGAEDVVVDCARARDAAPRRRVGVLKCIVAMGKCRM